MARHRSDEIAQQLGPRLKALRRQAGLTQEALATAAGIKAESISRIETGKACPDLPTLDRLLRVLGATFGEVLDPDSPRVRLSNAERDVLHAWRRLDTRRRRLGLDVLESMTAPGPEDLLAAEPDEER